MDLFHLHVHRYKKIFFGLNKNWLTLSFNQLQVEAKIPVRLSLIINEENFNLYIHPNISYAKQYITLFTNNEVDPNNYLQFTLTSKCTYMASSLSCRLVSKSLTHFLDSWCQIRLMMRAVTIGCSLCSHSDFTILGLLVRAAQ